MLETNTNFSNGIQVLLLHFTHVGTQKACVFRYDTLTILLDFAERDNKGHFSYDLKSEFSSHKYLFQCSAINSLSHGTI